MFEPYKLLENIENTEVLNNVLEIGVGTCKNLFAILSKNKHINIYGCDLDTLEKIQKTESFYLDEFEFFTPKLKMIFNENNSISRYELYTELAINKFNNSDVFTKVDLNEKLVNVVYGLDYKDYFCSLSTKLKFELILLAKIIHYEEINLNDLLSSASNFLSEEGSIFISYPINSGRKVINANELKDILELNQLIMLNEIQVEEVNYILCKKN